MNQDPFGSACGVAINNSYGICAIAKVNHPNILAVYDVGQQENRHFMIMELIDGGNLAELLEKAGVAIVPGSAFGTPDWVRVSYAAEQGQVEEAMHRLVAAFRELA